MRLLKKSRTLMIAGLALTFSQAFAAPQVDFERSARLPIVYLNVIIDRTPDPESKEGLANFTGEMLLRGTLVRTKEQLDTAFDDLGSAIGVRIQQSTLEIRGAVLSSELKKFQDLVLEILSHPRFPEKEIFKLKSEIISGIQEELGHDSTLASRRFNRFLFGSHPYGKSLLGKIKDIEGLTRKDILNYYEKNIQANNLMVLGSGDASKSQIEDWAQQLFKARPSTNGKAELAASLPRPTNPKHRRLLIIDKPDRTQTQINAGQIGILMTDPQFFPLYLGNYAFGGSFASIFMDEIRVKRGWSYGASSAFRYGTVPKSWSIHLFPAEKDTAVALAYSIKLLGDLKAKGLTQEQFDFSKQSLINNAGFMYNTPRKRIENKIIEKTLGLRAGFFESFASELEKVSLSDVNQSLGEFLKPEMLSISVLGTAKNLREKLAEAAGVPLKEVEVVPYTQE